MVFLISKFIFVACQNIVRSLSVVFRTTFNMSWSINILLKPTQPDLPSQVILFGTFLDLRSTASRVCSAVFKRAITKLSYPYCLSRYRLCSADVLNWHLKQLKICLLYSWMSFEIKLLKVKTPQKRNRRNKRRAHIVFYIKVRMIHDGSKNYFTNSKCFKTVRSVF